MNTFKTKLLTVNSPQQNIISIYHMVGGFLGIILSFYTVVFSLQNQSFAWTGLFFIILYALSLLAGYKAFNGKYKFLLYYNILQLPILSVENIEYSMNNGVLFNVSFIDLNKISYNFDIYNVRFAFSYDYSGPDTLGINIIALVFIMTIIIKNKV